MGGRYGGSRINERIAFFEERTWTAGVVGLGYVGLPLAVTVASRGLQVIGFDVSAERVATINAGTSPIEDVSDDELRDQLASRLRVTSDQELLKEADALFLCVPSPLGRNREPDMTFIRAAADTVRSVVQPGMLISLESTTYPGTTDEILVPAATATGLTLDVDVFVAFSPERVNPGADMKTGQIPKVVGGVSPTSTAVARAAYARIVDSVYPVSSAGTAEMAKLLENTYRAVNIGLVNEMAQLAHELGIDIWEVIDAASSKPFGFQPFYPGPGVGGHCIPLDPQFLAWRAKEAKFATRFIDVAEQVNTRMPLYTAARVADLLNEAGLPVFGTKIVGVGIAYKPDVADDRESAALEVLHQLARRGARIGVMDPVVGAAGIAQHGFDVISDPDDMVDAAIAVILTDHSALDLEGIVASVPIVLDTRNACRRAGIYADNVRTL